MQSMTPDASARIRALLADSLTLWKVRGDVTPGAPPVDAVIHAEDGTVVWVEPALASESPIRWWVRWHAPGAAARASPVPRSRPCTSAVGLLRTVREVLGAESGYTLRIAPSSDA